ncbi:hypothetical protein BRYFOR_08450 [Marvinbryantia formatexigens DSM 14469]|uniref:Cytidylate kinase-like family protein n=3 Tax=Marvinbryantia TaxID=248744 RepID=C6LIL0_9FIRM|nr:hypothetical protein BRYFOR_08450 [Marvinbryantia formatexigens DSM 14469]
MIPGGRPDNRGNLRRQGEILMGEQLIISVGREFGSGGHVIAEALAERFGLPLYDHNLLDEIAEGKNVDGESLKKYDEKHKKKLFSRTVRGHSNSMEDHVANMQFEFLQNMAEEGKSFVVVGRCAETKLRKYPALVSIFVLGDEQCKVQRVMERYHLSEDAARQKMKKSDWYRKRYHNYHCEGKWGDSRNYDFSINSSRLGLEKTVDFLEDYIKERQKA